jgi:hypothetical protein
MPRTLPTLLLSRRRVLALVVLAAAHAAVAQNNATVCPTDQLNWYSSVVGESPCRTYERLRQICDSRCARFRCGRVRSATMLMSRPRRGRPVLLDHARRHLRLAAALMLLQLGRVEPVHAVYEVRAFPWLLPVRALMAIQLSA